MFRTALISMFLTSTALATTWTVDDDGKADFDNIQAAVDASSDGDEIVVMPGTYTSTQDGHVVNMLGKAVTLRSSDPSDPDVVTATIIDGEGARRGLACFNEETNKTLIEGLTITNGFGVEFDYDDNGVIDWWENGGGGMFNYYPSSPTLENCTFTGNTAYRGGGMYNDFSSPTLTDCTFESNSADSSGGGMNNGNHSNPTLTNCTFTDNTADSYGDGGGMYNWISSPTLTDCTFTSNISYDGGGMYNFNYSSPTLTDCTFENNTANNLGGGCGVSFTSSPTLDGCTFTGNTADYGGGMHNEVAANSTLTNCTFTNNTATFGGGMYNSASNSTLNNCTFTGNTASKWGGGMYIAEVSNPNLPTLTVTTVCENSPDQIWGQWIDNGGNMIEHVCTPIGACCVDFSDGCYNVSELTCLAGSGTWLGPKTVCDDGECKSPSCEADIDGNGSVDVGDLLAVIDAWGLTDSPADLNQDGIVDVSDLLIVIGNWGECE